MDIYLRSAQVPMTGIGCDFMQLPSRPALPLDPLPDVLGWKYSGNRHHPTEKPVTSLQLLIESFTHPNAIVLDPFAGSGSTCVAAVQAGRRYIGIELMGAVSQSRDYPSVSRAAHHAAPGR